MEVMDGWIDRLDEWEEEESVWLPQDTARYPRMLQDTIIDMFNRNLT